MGFRGLFKSDPVKKTEKNIKKIDSYLDILRNNKLSKKDKELFISELIEKIEETNALIKKNNLIYDFDNYIYILNKYRRIAKITFNDVINKVLLMPDSTVECRKSVENFKSDNVHDLLAIAIPLIVEGNINKAYIYSCQYRINKKSYGLNVDFKKEIEQGLKPFEFTLYYEYIHSYVKFGVKTKDILALYLIYHFLGDNPTLKIYKETIDSELDNAIIKKYISKSRYCLYTLLAQEEIKMYYELNTTEYEILSCDKGSKCKKINGRKYKLEEAIVGTNFPPFSENCACTTVPVIDFD